MTLWRRLVGDRPIVTRLVLAVTGAMTVVLLAGGAFVFWRVQYALNRQLNQDLTAYGDVVDRAVAMARLAPEDPYASLADPEALARGALPDLDLYDPTEPSPE